MALRRKRLTLTPVSWLHVPVRLTALVPWFLQRWRLPLALGLVLLAVPTASASSAIVAKVTALLAQPVAASPETERAKTKAHEALQRAEGAATSSDSQVRSSLAALEQTALEWAKLRVELGQLAALQRESLAAQTQLQELDAQLKREQAYLEETEARRGRALAQLQKLGINAAPISAPSAPPVPTQSAGSESEAKP